MREREPFTKLGRNCFLITRGHDSSIADGLEISIVSDMGQADFILLGGLDENVAEPEYWRSRLSAAAARRLPMLCANPDLVMFGTSGLTPAPGALAALYQSLGGAVHFIGKPHPGIFEVALERLGHPAPERVLVIGDSLDHDVVGGNTKMGGAPVLMLDQCVQLAPCREPARLAIKALDRGLDRLSHIIALTRQ